MNTPVAQYMASPEFLEKMKLVSGQSSHTYKSLTLEECRALIRKSDE